jgi:hypothetical protein
VSTSSRGRLGPLLQRDRGVLESSRDLVPHIPSDEIRREPREHLAALVQRARRAAIVDDAERLPAFGLEDPRRRAARKPPRDAIAFVVDGGHEVHACRARWHVDLQDQARAYARRLVCKRRAALVDDRLFAAVQRSGASHCLGEGDVHKRIP